MDSLENLRYPTGRFNLPKTYDPSEIDSCIKEIEIFPDLLEKAVMGLSDAQLDTQYREEGWTIRQVVHHVADSHINSYVRFRWTLTEEKPTIKAYYEDRWAELKDARSEPIDISIDLLKALHRRWVVLLRNLSDEELHLSYIHPESGTEIQLYVNIALYAWHCRHHLAHVTDLRKRKGW